jgi:hypothetical protein
LVHLGQVPQQPETGAELVMQRIRGVSHYVQATALCRPLSPERGNDNVPAGSYGARDLAHVRGTVVQVGKKVKHGTVVPHVVLTGAKRVRCHITTQPIYCAGALTKTGLRHRECGCGDIQDGQISVSPLEQVIDQRRFAAANINDSRVTLRGRFLDQP